MKLTLLALSVVLPTFGAADANDPGWFLHFSSIDGLPVRQPFTAPHTTIPGEVPNFASEASLGETIMPGRMRYLFRDAPMRSTTRNPTRAFGLTSSDTLTDSAARLGAKPLIPCADPPLHAD
ncbi:hypothetical protein [Aminobacter sp. AP02]|uniref:hypothetical protein n=1 Tax=Aminobacter sp. AP02 TaxID=2135737 RepID=UPI000D6CA970|nr:hypothetical protein [Aminobacter sp. AP02]PWK65844.1 hypothetical protein C8K44_11559 [Aminobacter sp. AP02]